MRTVSGAWRRRATSVLLAVAVVAAALSGCTILRGPRPSDPTILYHHNWWNYYRRGTNYLRRAEYALARADFECALGIRPGATFASKVDKWRIPTYGIHIQDCYFPNRELGITLYYQGETARAVEQLEISLRQQESGRAKHYLNLARGRLLAEAGVDPPLIRLSPEALPPVTASRRRLLSGTVVAKGHVADIVVNGQRLFLELAEEEKQFSQEIELQEGTNVVTLAATDLRGQTAVTNVVWIADWTAPQISIRHVANSGNAWLVQGACSDDYGLSSVVLNGNPMEISAAENAPIFSAPLEHSLSREGGLVVEARDLAGNALHRAFTQNDVARWLVNNERELEGDVSAPRLWGCPTQELVTVLNDEFLIDVSSVDECGLAKVMVNAQDLLSDAARGALEVALQKRLPLTVGPNEVELCCHDLGGNCTTNVFTIVRKRPAHLDSLYRLSVGVSPTAKASEALAEKLQHSLESEILRQPVRFALLERRETWDMVLREIALSMPSISEPGCILRLGSAPLPADLLVVTSFLPESQGATIYGQVVDLSDGKVLLAEDVYLPTLSDEIEYKMTGLAMKIEQEFPLVQAKVRQLAGRDATIDAGSCVGVRNGMRFLVIEVGGPDDAPETGHLVMLDGKPVELRVTQPYESNSVGRLVTSFAEHAVGSEYYVYTR